MKYKAIIETDDYKDFEFYEDGNGKYMVGKDAGATASDGWIPLYFTECEQEPTYYPPCIDCHKKMDEIRLAYDKLKEHEPILDKIRVEIEELDRYYDNDYFSGNNDPMYKCNEVLLIIDKYREESEG